MTVGTKSQTALRFRLDSGPCSIPLHRVHHLAGYATLTGTPDDYFLGWLTFHGRQIPCLRPQPCCLRPAYARAIWQPHHPAPYGSGPLPMRPNYIGLLAADLTDTVAMNDPEVNPLDLDSYLPMLYTLIPTPPVAAYEDCTGYAQAMARIAELPGSATGADPHSLDAHRLHWVIEVSLPQISGWTTRPPTRSGLKSSPEELDALIDAFVVQETRFFRDSRVFNTSRSWSAADGRGFSGSAAYPFGPMQHRPGSLLYGSLASGMPAFRRRASQSTHSISPPQR